VLAQQFALPLNYRLIVGSLLFQANSGELRAECALAFICPAYQMSQDGKKEPGDLDSSQLQFTAFL